MKKILRILHAMPRCGSTLLSAHLASMPNVVFLSEIHPFRPLVGNPCDQACSWYDLLSVDEVEEWKHCYSCAETLLKLSERALARGQVLVVREWSYPDFKYPDLLHSLLPSWASSLARHCQPFFDELLRIYLVREPVDQWLSFRAFDDRCRFDKKNPVDLSSVMRSYWAFARMADPARTVRFEDFTRDPSAELQRVCAELRVPYADVGDAWKVCVRVTGDPDVMRSYQSVEVLPAKTVDPETLDQLRACGDYLEICRLLRYPVR